MKFEIIDHRKTVQFKEIPLGGLFKISGSDHYYMRIYPLDGYSAVTIASGIGFKIEEEAKVSL